MATFPQRGTSLPAQNVSHVGASGGRTSQVRPKIATPAQAVATNPLFGRPNWTYVQNMAGPVRGPQPRLAQGTGRTGDPSLPGNAVQLPGYLSDNEYFPSTFSYDPINQTTFQTKLTRTIMRGSNGREVVGTYNPHDVTIGQRFFSHWRQAASWQVYEYPPDNRNLLQWQQAQKYRLQSYTLQARPLTASNYFLGYQIDPAIASQIGQSTIGSLGSSG